MIHPTFRNINRVFVQSFKAGENDPTRNSFDKYYMTLVEIKYSNALIDNKQFFDQPIKKKINIRKTCRNIKKQWLYNRKLIRLIIPPKLL